MTHEELKTELANFQNKMKGHAEFICFFKPRQGNEIVLLEGNGGNMAAMIAIARMGDQAVRNILEVSNKAYEVYKDKVQP